MLFVVGCANLGTIIYRLFVEDMLGRGLEDEGLNSCGRSRDETRRGDRAPAKAHGGDWGLSHFVAYYENLLLLWV